MNRGNFFILNQISGTPQWIFQTNVNVPLTTFDPAITSTDLFTWELVGGTTYANVNALTISNRTGLQTGELNGTVQNVVVTTTADTFDNVTVINLNTDNIYGNVNLSQFMSLDNVILFTNPALTGVTNPVSNTPMVLYQVFGCNITGNLNLGTLTGLGGNIRLNLNTALTSITNPSSSEIITFYWCNNCNITGNLNLSTLTNLGGDIRFNTNSLITSVTNPSTSRTITIYWANNCDLGYVDFTPLTGTNNGISIRLQNNAMTATEVNHILVDLDAKGWINGTLVINGTNAAPDGSSGGYNGTTAKTNLIGKGWTVTTN